MTVAYVMKLDVATVLFQSSHKLQSVSVSEKATKETEASFWVLVSQLNLEQTKYFDQPKKTWKTGAIVKA